LKFSKSARLLKSCEYDHVFQQPTKITQRLATLYVRPNQLKHARIGLLVSKRAMKRAVDRNRIKRLVRESFRLHQQQLTAVDIIYVAREHLKHIDNKEVFSHLTTLWERLT
jgi:ribonuclease P protein component